MRLIDIYNIVISKGIENDPRSKEEINKDLKKVRLEFNLLKGADRASFDRERLKNPYADTRILFGDRNKDIRTILAGIDMETPEIILADRLNEHGASIDLVMAHHPEGVAWARLYDVMHIQVSILKHCGIREEIAERLMQERIDEVKRSLSPANHFRSVDAAKLLSMSYMCVHTPADNHVTAYLQRLFDHKRPKKLNQVMAILKDIPEYIDSLKKNQGPSILIGDANKPAGKILIDMTGGTEGSKKIFARLSQAGVGTIIGMHLSEDHFKSAKDEGINVIIAGHMASDNLGLNLIIDQIEKRGDLNVINCSGFFRVKRKGKPA